MAESTTKAASVPNQPVTMPPATAPSVSIADHVTDVMAFAVTSSRSATMVGNGGGFRRFEKSGEGEWSTVSA